MHEQIRNEGKIPSGSLVITFDDGYADNYEIAYPLLLKYGLTATIFVTTGHVGTTDMFWFEKISWYLKCLASYDLKIESLNFKEHIDENNRISVRDTLLVILKKVPNQVRLDALAELEIIFKEKVPETAHRLIKTLTWDQIVEMDRARIEIGSHTVFHPVLSSMEENEVRAELASSKEMLEDKLGHEVISLSYPVGGRSAFNPMVERVADEAGYRFGLSYVSGVNTDLSNPFSLKRIHIESYLSFRRFAAELYFPRLFFTV
jgi:peptidoglycan/xylan/chitin deacetylase (PgdA/CDA1 family)